MFCTALLHCVKLYSVHNLDNPVDIFNVKTGLYALQPFLGFKLGWEKSKIEFTRKGNVLPNQKTHVVCVYFPTFILHTLILSDKDWNSFDRKDKIFKVKQQSWSGWMHFPQRPVNNRQNSLNSTIYHVQMQIRGAAAGALLQVWLVDIGWGVCEGR